MDQAFDAKYNHVISQLATVPGAKRSSTYTMVRCAWHPDSNPSMRVKHNTSYPRSIGWCQCYTCGANEPWNEYAAKAGLKGFGPITEAHTAAANFEHIDSNLLEDSTVELGTEPLKFLDLIQNAYALGLEDKWRGFPLDFLETLGCKVVYHKDKERYFLWIPVNVNNQLVGYVKALPEKPTSKKFPSYLNAPGFWSKTKGLLMFDQSAALMRRLRLKTVVLVEGPRDALRLIKSGVPAIAILGTQSWSSEKVFLLQQHGAERFVLCMDGDDAGVKANKLLMTGTREKNDGEKVSVAVPLKDAVDELKVFKLWDYEGEYDPGNMPLTLLRKLKDLVI